MILTFIIILTSMPNFMVFSSTQWPDLGYKSNRLNSGYLKRQEHFRKILKLVITKKSFRTTFLAWIHVKMKKGVFSKKTWAKFWGTRIQYFFLYMGVEFLKTLIRKRSKANMCYTRPDTGNHRNSWNFQKFKKFQIFGPRLNKIRVQSSVEFLEKSCFVLLK